jgi:hypothetical protein
VKELNTLKNRAAMPGPQDIDTDVSLAAMLAPGQDDHRFDAGKAATVTGFVVRVLPGGSGESCNCGARDPVDMDTHIELALSASARPNQRAIVEVTPRIRKQKKDQTPPVDWSTETLSSPARGIKGKWVTVTGWLLFDFMHVDKAENNNPGNPANFRATCWEVHPVTRIEVLAGPPADTPELHPALFSAFQSARVRELNRNPQRKETIERQREAYREGLTEGERREAENEAQERARDRP